MKPTCTSNHRRPRRRSCLRSSPAVAVAVVAAVSAALVLPSSVRCEQQHPLRRRAAASASSQPFGYQTGLPGGFDDDGNGDGGDGGTYDRSGSDLSFDDDSFASYLSYDSRTGIAYVAGGTYGAYFDRGGEAVDLDDPDEVHLGKSDCFVAAIALTRGTEAGAVKPRVLDSFRAGADVASEACASLSVLPPSSEGAGKTRLVAAGHAEEGGTLTGLREIGNKAHVYGYALDVELDVTGDVGGDGGGGASSPNRRNVSGGRLLHSAKATYPVSVVTPPPSRSGAAAGRTEDAYVASLTTDDEVKTNSFVPPADDSERDPIRVPRLGRTFDVTILKLGRKTQAEIENDAAQTTGLIEGGPDYPYQETSKVLWERTFAPADEGRGGGERPGVEDLAGLLYVPSSTSSRNGDGNDGVTDGGPYDEGGVDVGGASDSSDGGGDDFLLLAGTTSGYGSAFGGSSSAAPLQDSDGRKDLDGFVTKLRTDTGEEMLQGGGQGQPQMMPGGVQAGGGFGLTVSLGGGAAGEEEEQTGAGATAAVAQRQSQIPPHSVRISSQPGRDDVVRSICVQQSSAAGEGSPTYAYVVGSTAGVMDPDSLPSGEPAPPNGDNDTSDPPNQAFLLKLDLDAMTIEWARQFGSPGNQEVRGTGCAVSSDGKAAYLAGTVFDGGTISHRRSTEEGTTTTNSNGGDDAFLVKIGTEEGNVEWMRQVGTAEDDRLAEGGGGGTGGGGVESDGTGGAILYGSTRGSLMRWRGYTDDGDGGGDDSGKGRRRAADMFVLQVTSGGDYRPTAEQQWKDSGGYTGYAGPRPPKSTPSSSSSGADPTVGLAAKPSAGRKTHQFLVLGLMLTSLVAIVLASHKYLKGNNGYGNAYSRDEIEKYLRAFRDDDCDVDVRASATGGWHGMYSFDTDRVRSKLGYSDGTADGSSIELMSVGSSRSGDADSAEGGSPSSLGSKGMGGRRGRGKEGFYSTGGNKTNIGLSSSSVVKDAFFFEDDPVVSASGKRQPTVGFGPVHDVHDDDLDDLNEGEDMGDGMYRLDSVDFDGDDHGGGGEGYAGLVESYNATWEQRNPHSMGGLGLGGADMAAGGGAVGLGRSSPNTPGPGTAGRKGLMSMPHGDDFDDAENDPGRLREIL